MLKKLLSLFILTACFTANAATQEDNLAVDVSRAHALVEKQCTEGCIILSPKDVEDMGKEINEALKKVYNMGLVSCKRAADVKAL